MIQYQESYGHFSPSQIHYFQANQVGLKGVQVDLTANFDLTNKQKHT